MISSVGSVLRRAVVPGAIAAVASIPLALPSQAHAWWRGGVWIGLPPVVVAPPAYYAPPPVVYPPPVYYPYRPYPHRVWVPAHWQYGYWVPGHWA